MVPPASRRLVEDWDQVRSLTGILYSCGYCGADVAPAHGFATHGTNARIAICPRCNHPTFLVIDVLHDVTVQVPGAVEDGQVEHLPDDVAHLFHEARVARSVSANTAAVLLCRKILMHVAVDLGASPGSRFIEHVDYLAESGYIPPNARHWVDHIRRVSNEANHEIVVVDEAGAKLLMRFTEQMLRIVYELPQAVPAEIADQAPPDT